MVLAVVLCEEAARPPLGWKAGREPVGAQTRSGWGRWAGPVGVRRRFVLFRVGEGCLEQGRKVHRFRRVFGAGARKHNRFRQAPGARRSKVDPPTLRDDLLELLRGSGALR